MDTYPNTILTKYCSLVAEGIDGRARVVSPIPHFEGVVQELYPLPSPLNPDGPLASACLFISSPLPSSTPSPISQHIPPCSHKQQTTSSRFSGIIQQHPSMRIDGPHENGGIGQSIQISYQCLYSCLYEIWSDMWILFIMRLPLRAHG